MPRQLRPTRTTQSAPVERAAKHYIALLRKRADGPLGKTLPWWIGFAARLGYCYREIDDADFVGQLVGDRIYASARVSEEWRILVIVHEIVEAWARDDNMSLFDRETLATFTGHNDTADPRHLTAAAAHETIGIELGFADLPPSSWTYLDLLKVTNGADRIKYGRQRDELTPVADPFEADPEPPDPLG